MPHHYHELACLELLVAEDPVSLSAFPASIRALWSVPLAQEDEAEGCERVERNPEAGDELLLERDRRRLGLGLILGQLLHFGRLSRVDIVDQTFDRWALLGCARSVMQILSIGARLADGAIWFAGDVPIAAVWIRGCSERLDGVWAMRPC